MQCDAAGTDGQTAYSNWQLQQRDPGRISIDLEQTTTATTTLTTISPHGKNLEMAGEKRRREQVGSNTSKRRHRLYRGRITLIKYGGGVRWSLYALNFVEGYSHRLLIHLGHTFILCFVVGDDTNYGVTIGGGSNPDSNSTIINRLPLMVDIHLPLYNILLFNWLDCQTKHKQFDKATKPQLNITAMTAASPDQRS